MTLKHTSWGLFGATTLIVAAAASASADVTYQDDTGNPDHQVGESVQLDFMWVSRFDAVPGGNIITAILFEIGDQDGVATPPPATVTVVLYDDPNDDGNPDDAVLLTSVSGIVPAFPNTNNLQTVPITPTAVSGQFLIGVYAICPAGSVIAPVDSHFNWGSGHEFFVEGQGQPGTLNLSSPGHFVDLNAEASPSVAGVWVLRAIANPEPGTIALFAAGLGGLCAFAWRRRRAATSPRS